MRKSAKLIFILAVSGILAACQVNAPSSSASSESITITSTDPSTDPSGDTSDTSDSSDTSDPTSVDPSTEPSSSEPGWPVPVTSTLNVYNAAIQIGYAAWKYDKTITVDSLIAAAKALDSELSDSAPDATAKLTERDLVLLVYCAFRDVVPEHIGARTYAGYYYDLSKLTLKDTTKDSGTYTAIEWLQSIGVFTTRSTFKFNAKTAAKQSALDAFVDRLHAYIGGSLQDDFFSTVNHDYLYDENPYRFADATHATKINAEEIVIETASGTAKLLPGDLPANAETVDTDAQTGEGDMDIVINNMSQADGKACFVNGKGYFYNKNAASLRSITVKGADSYDWIVTAGDYKNPHNHHIDPTFNDDGTIFFDLTGYSFFKFKARGEFNVYGTNLIPQGPINDWAYSLYDAVPEAKNFAETYLDQESRVAGNANGIVDYLRPFLEAANIQEYIAALKDSIVNDGYCVLWEKLEYGDYAWKYGDSDDSTVYRTSYVATPFSFTNGASSVREGSTGFNESVERFAPIFQEVLGGEEGVGRHYAEEYTRFKYNFAVEYAKRSDDQGKYYNAEAKDDPYGDNFNFYQFLAGTGLADPSWVLFNDAAAIKSILSLFSDEYLDCLKGFTVWQTLQHYTLCLPNTEAAMKWAYNDGYSNEVEMLSDENNFAYYALPYIGGNLVNYYSTTPEYEAKTDAVIAVLADLKEAMSDRIDAQEWLSAEGKVTAHAKLDSCRYSIAGRNSDGTKYVYAAPEYKSKAEGGSLRGNMGIYDGYLWNERASLIGRDWSLAESGDRFFNYAYTVDPLTANAFFLPSGNGIDITMGYLAAYLGIDEMDEPMKLSSYGWVVGHELSHGFDANGMKYDKDGINNEGLFSADDVNAYNSRLAGVISLYDSTEVLANQLTSGKTVNTEAVADITGLELCMDIAKKYENFDYEEFFVAGAENFAHYASQYTYTSQLASDEHPFGRARVNCAYRCIDEFYETFGIREGDNMYIAPEGRPTVW